MMMKIEKRRSKGSFLSFFDWNGKSQKKLLFNDPNLPEVSNQGKENIDNSLKSKINMDDSGETSSNIANCDFNSELFISSAGGCESKTPGLVARLMGLDSLPVSSVSQSYDEVSRLHDDCRADSMNMTLMAENSSWGAMESKTYKVGNQPMNRFQNETLPPNNAAHIMETAAKIIEASPWPYMRNVMSSVGSSPVPLRILDLKENLEATQHESKLEDLHTALSVNGKLTEKRSNLNKRNPTFKGSRDFEKNSSHLGKGKHVSLAVPSTKGIVQSRDALTLNDNRRNLKQKKQNKMKSNQLSSSQKKQITDRGRVMQQKKCNGENNNVLRPSIQKQNSITNKDTSTSKAEADTNMPSQTHSSESSTRSRKTTNRGVVNGSNQSKRSSTRVTDKQKEVSVSKRKSFPQKNGYVRRDDQNDYNAVNTQERKSIKCNVTIDRSIDQDAFSMKQSSDVISFTFTSPLRRNVAESQSTTKKVVKARTRIDCSSFDHSDRLYPETFSLSPTSLHVVDGDTLSVLLEKKLQELTYKINLQQCTLATEGCSGGLRSSCEDRFHSGVSTASREQDRSFHPNLLSNKLDSMDNNCCSSSDNMVLNMNEQLQILESMEELSCSSNSESGNDLSYQHARTVTAFEYPSISKSYMDSEDSTCGGNTVYSSMQDEEVSSSSPINNYKSLENERKWSEQSSSIMIGGYMAMKQPSLISYLVDFTRSARKTELEYVKDILSNAELMSEDFMVGQTDKIIMPNLFDLLENQRTGLENYDEYSKLERKVIFDSVTECLELRCRQVFVGSCKAWSRWVASIQRKNWLAEELYKEMLGFSRREEEVLVDEVVSKDMGIRWGTWLDFDTEAFEEGLELELYIVNYLIEELVSDW